MRLVAFLAPVAYAGMILAGVLHEVAGHGLVALALGGTFTGFTVRWDGTGLAHAFQTPGAPVWHELAILSGGIAVTTMAGLAMAVYSRTRKSDTARGAVCAVLAAFVLLSGLEYSFWSGLQRAGPGDTSRVLEILREMRLEHFELGRSTFLAAVAVAAMIAQWWGLRLVLRHFETRFGHGRPLSIPRRALVLIALVIPGAAAYFLFDYEEAIPGAGWLPASAGTTALVLTAAVVARFPLPPFPSAATITRGHLATAWAAAAIVATCLQISWNAGVSWGLPGQSGSAERDPLLTALREAKDVSVVEGLATQVSSALAARPEDGDQARELLTWLGLAWKRVGEYDRALASFERLGREWPDYRAIAHLLDVSALVDRGDLDAAASRASAFVAANSGSDRNVGLHSLAMLEERRGNWSEALKAAEEWAAPDGPLGLVNRTSNVVLIARCRHRLGRTPEALSTLEAYLSDRRQPFSTKIATAYAEIAAEGGRLDDARRFLAGLPAENRDACQRSLAIGGAWLSRDPAAMLQVFANGGLDSDQKGAAGRLLGELGTGAARLLEDRISAGDLAAIEAAGNSGLTMLIPALEKRYQASAAGSEEEGVAGQALAILEALAARSASRPASQSSK